MEVVFLHDFTANGEVFTYSGRSITFRFSREGLYAGPIVVTEDSAYPEFEYKENALCSQ